MIPLSVPHISGNEWRYIKECLDTEWVSSAGKYVDKFESDICAYTGARHAVACTNGTAALQVALRLVGVIPGDEIIIPTVTFIAPVNVARYLRAEPVFMDCDKHYNIDVGKTIEFIINETVFRDGHTFNKGTDKRISAIIPVHIFGNAVDIEQLISLCRERNIKIVEDATESLGTYYSSGEIKGKFTGTLGDIGCYSFNGNKIITTGGGGMIVTDNGDYAGEARYLTTQAKDDPVRYIHNAVGYNFRLTNIQAAMGVAQLEKLEEFIEIKKRNFHFYQDELDELDGLHIVNVPSYARNNCWMYAMLIDKDKYGKNREEVMGLLAGAGIQSRPLWYLNHLQEPYKACQAYRIEKAYDMLDKTLNIPCSVGLKEEEARKVISILKH